MRGFPVLCWLAALVTAFGLGRWVSGPIESDAPSVESFREALAADDPVMRAFGISRFLRRLSAENVDAVLAAIEPERLPFLEDSALLLMTAWTEFDGGAASDWAFGLEEGPERDLATAAVIDAWAFRNPAAAHGLVYSIEDAKSADRLHDHLVEGWARSGRIESLTGFLMDVPDDIRRQRGTSILTLEIMRRGADALIEWAEAIPDDARGDYKQTAFHKASNTLATFDSPRAARWIEAHLDTKYARAAPGVVARRWADTDPAAALEWLLSIPPSADRNDDLLRVFENWLQGDPANAEAWLLATSPAQRVDSAVYSIVKRDSRSRPRDALDWAQRIHEPAVKRRVLNAVGRSWCVRDPEACAAWLPVSGLEKGIQDRILRAEPTRTGSDGS